METLSHPRWRWCAAFVFLLPLLGCGGGNYSSGDRVLVAKCLYETGVKPPARFDVVVFKYPKKPMDDNVPTNYIKRLMGLPGEIIAIFFGQIFRMQPPPGGVPDLPEVTDGRKLWEHDNQPGRMFHEQVKDWFAEGKFEIVRKPPEVMLAMRRIVNDNNYQAADLKHLASRWEPAKAAEWKMAGDRKSFTFNSKDDAKVEWLTYQNLMRPPGPLAGNAELKPSLITDAMGYNDITLFRGGKNGNINWAGDLMLEADVDVTQGSGEFLMALNKGVDRFEAKWDLASGQCTLSRIGEDGKAVELQSAPTSLRGTGTHTVRFANFDARLTVWVGRELPFGDGVNYDPPELPRSSEKIDFAQIKERTGPRKADLERPASLGAKNTSLTITNLRLWRDTYYTMGVRDADLPRLAPENLTNPNDWDRFKELTPTGFYVYPGHYLCLGDNSTHSSDGRDWGLVPDRLMLGRALMVYYPVQRASLIR